MRHTRIRGVLVALALSMALPCMEAAAATHADLVALFKEFRALVPPPVVDGVPDYSPAAMQEQHRALQEVRARLDAINDSSWPIAERVDYMIVLAEMRGMDFNHRVLKPWQRDPAFYSTTDLGFGPKLYGAFSVPELPLKKEQVAALAAKLRAVPAILEAARKNLTDPRGDLARLAIVQKRIERNVYDRLSKDAARHHPSLVKLARDARDADDRFMAWLEEIEANLPPHAGVGKQEYDWYLRHVLLFPYTWDEMLIISEREYQRTITFLKLEEHQNRGIPMPEPVTTRAEFDRARTQADTEMIAYLRDQRIMSTPDYLAPPGDGPYMLPAERDPAKPGLFEPPIKRHFFFEAEFRDPRPLRAHNVPGHFLDGRMRSRDTRPIRGGRRMFFVDGNRAEGWAFYLEEMLLQIGYLDQRPKAREITYILQAKRAARVLPELMMQANEWTYDQALHSLTSRTPYWMKPDDAIARFDIELYLRQPGYGIGYYMGKVELEKLLSERAMQLGEQFDLQRFHDEFLRAGVIPISLIRWEMTGKDDEMQRMR
ncbi:MAG TPA: DUF885 family protein [Steroidobacteraceae bacterium]|nr:DUF885 family protein [Steroidobacteraceae bacterium]